MLSQILLTALRAVNIKMHLSHAYLFYFCSKKLEIHYQPDQLKFLKPVSTMGMFDGLHSGHRMLLKRLREISQTTRRQSLVISFWPHPRLVLNPEEKNLYFLNTLEEKIQLLESLEIDHLLLLEFNLEFANQTACEFIQNFLTNELQISYLLVGFNHVFGKDRLGSFVDLQKCSSEAFFQLEKYEAFLLNNEEVSSTLVRLALNDGNIDKANELLGYLYEIRGEIVVGNQIGRKIGFPTANIEVSDRHKLIPATGVYAVQAELLGKHFLGMLNIGYRPTIAEAGKPIRLEVHLFGFDREAYGEKICVKLVEKVRDEKKFDGLEDLKHQLSIDYKVVSEIFKKERNGNRDKYN